MHLLLCKDTIKPLRGESEEEMGIYETPAEVRHVT